MQPSSRSDPSSQSGSGADDLILVRRALAGEGTAIEAVLGRLACTPRFVHRLNQNLGYRLPSEALADVVQQVYTAVWPRLADFAGGSALESWVFGFCRNCLRAEARRRAQRLRVLRGVDEDGERDEAVSTAPGPERRLVHSESLDALREELDRLAPVEREAVELRHLEGWDFERIAGRLGLPASTVKDRCYRALAKMRGRLRRRDVSA